MTGDAKRFGGDGEDAVVQADDGDLVKHEDNFVHDYEARSTESFEHADRMSVRTVRGVEPYTGRNS